MVRFSSVNGNSFQRYGVHGHVVYTNGRFRGGVRL